MPIPALRDDGWLPEGHHRADWDEVFTRFGGAAGSRRASLTDELRQLRDALRTCGVTGTLLLDGSYISVKTEPGDFDVLLIAPADIQVHKGADPSLADLLDARRAEERGYSLFYIPIDSPVLAQLRTLWDVSKEGVPKGVVEVEL